MSKPAGISIKQRWEVWYNVANPDKTVKQAIDDLQEQCMKELGHKMKILEIDEENRRFKVLDKRQ